MLHVLDCLFTLATYDTTIPDIKGADAARFSGIIKCKTIKVKIVNKLWMLVWNVSLIWATLNTLRALTF